MGNSFTNVVFSLRRLFFGREVKMLCIGMEQSNFAGSCLGADKGATKFFNKAKSRCSYAKLLINEKATKTKVISEMLKVCNSDLAIIMYAGHGGQERAKHTADEPDGKNELIYLYDSPMFDDEIWNIVSGAKGRVLTVFDCCHSETMYRGYAGKIFDFNQVRGEGPDLMCWSACADNQVGYATSVGGFMTSCIVRNIGPWSTYDKVWDKVLNDKNLAKHELVKRTILQPDSKFKNERMFS